MTDFANSRDAAIALCDSLIESWRDAGVRTPTLCVIRRRLGKFQVVPLAAAKAALGDWYLSDFDRIEWISLTGHEPRC